MDRRSIAIGIALAINGVLIVLPFFDAYNTNEWLAFASTFHNTRPAFANSLWPGGPFTTAALLPTYWAYVSSGFNFSFAIIVLKALLFVFILGMALTLYKVARQRDLHQANVVLLFTLLSPALLFVSYIWSEIDIIPAYMTLLSYVILRLHPISSRIWLNQFLALVPLMVGIFFYLYPVILLPTYLTYSKTNKERVSLVAAAAVLGGFGVAAESFLFRGGLYDYLSAATGGVINSGVIGLHYFVTYGEVQYLATVGVLVVALPIYLWLYKIPEASVIFVVLTLFVFSSPAVIPDNYIWVYPFGALLLLTVPSKAATLRSLLIVSALPIVSIFILNFWIGRGFEAGIFYFGYSLFHLNILFLRTSLEASLYFLFFSLTVTLLVALTCIYAVFDVNMSLANVQELPRPDAPTSKSIEPQSPPSQVGQPPLQRRPIGWPTWVAVIVGLAVISLLLNFTVSNSIDTSNPSNAPSHLFQSQYLGTHLYAQPVQGKTYVVSGDSMVFSQDSPAIDLNRSLTGESIKLNLSTTLSGLVPTIAPIIQSPGLSAGVLNVTTVNLSEPSQVAPASSFNCTALSLEPDITQSNISIFYLAGNGSRSYVLPGSNLSSGTFSLFYKVTGYSNIQDVIFHVTSPFEVFELVATPGPQQTIAYQNLSSKVWNSIVLPSLNISRLGWNFLSFTAQRSDTLVNVDGLAHLVPLSWGNESITVNVGIPFAGSGGNYSFIGDASSLLYTHLQPELSGNLNLFLTYGNATTQTEPATVGAEIHFSVNSGPSGVTLAADGMTVSRPTSAAYVSFGKLSFGDYSIKIQVSNLIITGDGFPSLFLAVDVFSMGVPFLVVLLYGDDPLIYVITKAVKAVLV